MKLRIAAIAAMTTLMGGAALTASSTPVFYGYECYNTEEKLGWYSLDANGNTDFQWTDATGATGIPMSAGWRRNDKLCGISSLLVENKLYALDYVELDEKTGEILLSRPIEVGPGQYLNYYMTAAYNPSDDRVYGYGWSADGNQFVFKSSDAEIKDTQVIRVVGSDEICASLCFNEETGQLVGFNRKSFVTIDPVTGIQTEVFNPGISNYSYSYTAIGYDPESGKYYWNMFTKEPQSHLYVVDMNAKTCVPVCDYYNMTQFSFFVPADTKGDPKSPSKPEFESADFPQGALSGTIIFKMPSSLVDGSSINGNLSWRATLDGVEIESGEASPATAVTISVKDITEGMHSFGVRATLGDKTSRQGVWNAYIGHDTPSSPTNVKLEGTSLTWDAVTTGANAGYVDPSSISYTVYLNGVEQGKTADNSYTITFPADLPYTTYTASVTADYSGKTSLAGMSQTVRYGNPLSLPVDLNPTIDEAQLFDSVDALGEDAVWTYDNSQSGRENFKSPLSEGEPVDSWLFMPPVATSDSEGVYEFSIRTALSDVSLSEGTLEVMVGNAPTPESMAVTVISPLELTSASIKEFKGLFSPAALGGTDKVYIGLRVKSETGNYSVIARRFIVKPTSMKATIAEAPVIESVEALPQGELKAKVTVALPTKRMNGESIPSGSKVSANVTCNYNSASAEGEPGSKVEVTVPCSQGENYLTVTSVLNGENGGYSYIRVFTGEAIPGGVTNFKIDIPADNLTAVVTWDAPESALSEGYFNADKINYYYCPYNSSAGDYLPEANLGTDKNYTIEAPKAGSLTNVNFAIQTRSAAGASPELVGDRVQLGKPYALPMNESFYNALNDRPAQTYAPLTMVTSGDYAGTAWYLRDPKDMGEQYVHELPVALMGEGLDGTTGYLQLPKFSTEGFDRAGIELSIYGESTTPAINVWAYSTDNQESPVAVGTIKATHMGSYHSYGLQLPESLQNQGWVSLVLNPVYETESWLAINYYSVLKTIGISLPSANEICFGAIGGKGELKVNAEGETIIYALDGRKVWSGHIDGEKTIILPPALYIVNCGEKSTKATVR